MDLASIYFGLFLGVFVFAVAKIIDQTRSIWRRTQSVANAYLWLIWVEALVNVIFAIVTFLFLNHIIDGSLPFFLATVALWAIQTQLLPQIIANRVGLIMTNKRTVLRLKLGLAVAIGVINACVAYIWTVAQLPSASPEQVSINHIFEKAEKSFFLVVDLALNIYFLYLVRFRLIADGLSKYWRLFNFNAGMVVLSTSMDILLLGFLSLPNPYLYVQFAPLAYIVKLYIELVMAVLISKVVRSGGSGRNDGWYAASTSRSNPAHHTTSRVVVSGTPAVPKQGNTLWSGLGKDVPARKDSSGSDVELAPYPGSHGITKTVETTISVHGEDSSSN